MNMFSHQNQEFIRRHIGPGEKETQAMLQTIDVSDMEALIQQTVPDSIRMRKPLAIPPAINEADYLRELKEISLKNKVCKSYIGLGYYDTHTPSVILRNIFENPGWYTQYTPYQAEISQGRLESLLNFQTMVSDLTGLPIANASLLDEATAAAEAMTMFFNAHNKNHDSIEKPKFFVDNEIFPQTKDLILTRAQPLGIEVVMGKYQSATLDSTYFGALVQYPNNIGSIEDYREFIATAHSHGAYVAMATDLLALTLLTPPGELGADVALGSAQRLGVPLGFGGPHAAFFATKDEFKRSIPGRIIGVSIDAHGNRALRMALQTREQHIKREKATSNICTAQALLANMAAMYAVYHGPKGLKAIASRINILAETLAKALRENGHELWSDAFFDTIVIKTNKSAIIQSQAEKAKINFRYINGEYVGISLDETTSFEDLADIINILNDVVDAVSYDADDTTLLSGVPEALQRTSAYLTHPTFNSYHSETKMMRYIKSLEN